MPQIPQPLLHYLFPRLYFSLYTTTLSPNWVRKATKDTIIGQKKDINWTKITVLIGKLTENYLKTTEFVSFRPDWVLCSSAYPPCSTLSPNKIITMRVLILPQQLHGGEIHSMDINASATWMVTGGIDQKVAFWDLLDFANINTENTANASFLGEIRPKSTLAIDSGTVSLLRWCPTMDHLVVAADTSGNVSVLNVRDLTRREVFTWPDEIDATRSAVIDGSWSRDGRLFAWTTANSQVHLYDIERHTHQRLVEGNTPKEKISNQCGIAFDPTSNLLATVGDDTHVTIYQYQFDNNGNYQFKVFTKISKLLTSTAMKQRMTTSSRRLSWSCDGEFFAVPNAAKQQTSLISLLSRTQGWDNKVNLVGHGLECDLVKFAPRIFDSREKNPHIPDSSVKQEGATPVDEDANLDVFHIVASAGSDNSFVVWNTTKESPLVVVKDITAKPITDMAWNLSLNSMFMVSGDGRVVVATFADGELGYAAPEEFLDKLKASQKHSIKAFLVRPDETTSTKAKVVKQPSEIVDQKNATDIQKAFSRKKNPELEKTTVESNTNDTLVSSPASDASTIIMGDISPVVPPPEPLEDRDTTDVLQNAMDDRTGTTDVSTVKAVKAKADPRPTKKTTVGAQKVTMKDGVKRIQPILISNGNKFQPSAKENSSSELPMNNISNRLTTNVLMEFDRPSYLVSESFQKEAKRTKAQDGNGVAKKPKRPLEPVKFIGSVVVNPNTTFSRVRLSIPKARATFRLRSRLSELIVLDIRNGEGNENTPSRVSLFKNEAQLWTDFIPKLIQLAVEGEDFWAVCTLDGQIYAYSHLSGKRILPPIVLGAPLSFLECHGKFLMAVTSIGELYVWNMEKKRIHIHNGQSVAALLDLNSKYQEDGLSRADSISMCSITSKGIPLVTLSNGSGYLFNIDLEVWQTVSETWWAFGSHYWDSITDDKVTAKLSSAAEGEGVKESSIIGLLEHKTNEEIVRKSRLGRGKYFNKILKNMIMKEGFENLENIISLSHMENRILCCELLGEKADFKEFIITYAKRLSELGLKGKLFELCQDLLGQQTCDSDVICGHNKHGLLKEIIVDCAEHRDSQRILTYFGQKLGLVAEEY